MDKRIKEVKIEVPEGYEIDRENSTLERIVFKKKNELPESWEEFCEMTPVSESEVWISTASGITTIGYRKIRHEDSDANLLATEKDALQHLALIKLHRLRDCYRKGWVPDWLTSTKKWCVMLLNGHVVTRSSMSTSHFLSFDSEDTANKFAMTFFDLIKQAGDLI